MALRIRPGRNPYQVLTSIWRPSASARVLLDEDGMRFPIAHKLASRRPAGGDDRVCVLRREDHVVIAVADGAGGIGSGSRAADAAIQHVRERLDASSKPEPMAVLRDADAAVRAAARG